MSMRKLLSDEERVAVALALEGLVDHYGNQRAVEKVLGISQQTISRATSGLVGVPTARIVTNHLKTDLKELVAKHRAKIDAQLAREAREPRKNTARVSPVIGELAKSRRWSDDTVQQLELRQRAAKLGNANGDGLPVEELVVYGDMFERANRDAADRVELMRLKREAV